MLKRALLLSILGTLGACNAVGTVDTAAMQTTNKVVGAPVNGPSTR